MRSPRILYGAVPLVLFIAFKATQWHTWTREWTARAESDGAEALVLVVTEARAAGARLDAERVYREFFAMPAPFTGKYARRASTRNSRRNPTVWRRVGDGMRH